MGNGLGKQSVIIVRRIKFEDYIQQKTWLLFLDCFKIKISIINVYNIVNNIFLLHLTLRSVICMSQQMSQLWLICFFVLYVIPSNSCVPYLFIDLGVLQIEAVTRRILWIKATDHEAKVLVFSSWNDVLDVLEHAFAANNITYIRMKGGRYNNLSYCYSFIYLRICVGLEDIWRQRKKE